MAERRGNEAFAAGSYNDAIKHYTEYLKSDETSPKAALVFCNRALAYVKMDMLKKALKDAQSAIDIDPNCQRAYLRKGNVLLALKKPQEARDAFAAGAAVWGDVELTAELLARAAGEPPPVVAAVMETIRPTTIVLEAASDPRPPPPVTGTLRAKAIPATGTFEEEGPAEPLSLHAHRGGVPGTAGAAGTTVAAGGGSGAGGAASERLSSGMTIAEASEMVAKQGVVQNRTGDVTLDARMATSYMLVNTGRYAEGIAAFDDILRINPKAYGAYLGRGTAYALSGQIKRALKDFDDAVKISPTNHDGWRRRGQALAALGMDTEALASLNEAQKHHRDAEGYHQRGLVYHKLKDYKLAAADFAISVQQERNNALSWNYLGLCQAGLGNVQEAVAAYSKAVEVDPKFKEAWANLGQIYRDVGNTTRATELFIHSMNVDPTYPHSPYLLGLLKYHCGDIRGALTDLSLTLQLDSEHKEAMHMRAVCYHTLGLYPEAIEHYTQLVARDPNHISWYQRECALYHARRLDTPLSEFNMDTEMDKYFKEGWGKRHSPAMLVNYRPQPKLTKEYNPLKLATQPSNDAARTLLRTAALFEMNLQYQAPGFVRNTRQLTMGGLAILEAAQKLSVQWAARRRVGKFIDVPGKASSGNTSRHEFGWRDLFDMAVQWRQYSEPNDPVWWVDLLSPEQFAEGFGSQTPMVTGQLKVIRYYPPGYARSFTMMKDLMLEQCTLSANDRGVVAVATELHELYSVMKRDYYVITPCRSLAVPGRTMEGTRLTVQLHTPNGYDFSIRTPGTPARWREYDEELAHAWALLTEAVTAENPSLEAVVDGILTLVFYWYNFMPLSRGSAMCGLIVMNAVLLSFDHKIDAPMPEGVQVDWEAILRPTPASFIEAIKPWALANCKPCRLLEGLPAVGSTFPTLRAMVSALNVTDL